MSTYWNTTNLTGEQLANAVKVAAQQDDAVMVLMAIGIWSPSQVWSYGCSVGRKWLLTSVRRSISNLEKAGALKKTGIMVQGPYGRQENTWSKA